MRLKSPSSKGRERIFFFAGGWRENALKARLEQVALELVRRGHKVVIIVDGQRLEIERPGANPSFYTWPSARPTRLTDARFLAHLIRTRAPDCLVAHFGAVNLMMLVGKLMGVNPRVAWHHTLSSQTAVDSHLGPAKLWFLRIRKRAVFSLANHLIANSEATRKDLMDVYRIPGEKIRIEPYFLVDPTAGDPSFVSMASIPRRVVCVGQLRPSKGQDTLIRAAALLADIPGLVIDFVGSGESEQALRSLARDLGLEHICVFSGVVPHVEVFRKFAQAEVSVVPSLDEAFGFVCIESLSVGTPVVASKVGGIPENIRDGIDGILVPPGDPEALAAALRRILEDGETRNRMKIHARQRFLDRFEAAQSVHREADWLESIVSKG